MKTDNNYNLGVHVKRVITWCIRSINRLNKVIDTYGDGTVWNVCNVNPYRAFDYTAWLLTHLVTAKNLFITIKKIPEKIHVLFIEG